MARLIGVEKKTPMSWGVALQKFLFWKQAQGVSERTLKDYRQHINRFFVQFGDAFDEANLRTRVLEYMAQEVMPATFNLRREYLGGLFTTGRRVSSSRPVSKTAV